MTTATESTPRRQPAANVERGRLAAFRPPRLGAWLFIAPAVLLVFALTLYPLGFAAVISFFDYDVTRSVAYYVEWENFAELAAGPFVHALRVTLLFAIPAVAIEMVLGIAIAVLLQSPALRRLSPAIMAVILMPLLMHGFYDFCATSKSDVATIVFLGYIIVLDLIAIRQIRKFSREDEALYEYDVDRLNR